MVRLGRNALGGEKGDEAFEFLLELCCAPEYRSVLDGEVQCMRKVMFELV